MTRNTRPMMSRFFNNALGLPVILVVALGTGTGMGLAIGPVVVSKGVLPETSGQSRITTLPILAEPGSVDALVASAASMQRPAGDPTAPGGNVVGSDRKRAVGFASLGCCPVPPR